MTFSQRDSGVPADTFTPKMVALDIDGTLVDAAGNMPDEVHQAVRRVADAGIPVVLATGRGWLATQPIFEMLGLPQGWSVSANGAVIVHNPPFQLVHEMLFDPRETIEKVTQALPTARLCVERGLVRYATRPFPEGELEGEVHIVSVEELCAQPVSRLIIREPERDGNEVFSELIADLGMHDVSYFVGWSAWIDVAPRGVDKATGLQLVCDDLGIRPDDVLALGDGRNDIEMLRWAGRGVAMGQAPDEVKAAADAVTFAFDDLGTVRELDRWFGTPAQRTAARGNVARARA